MVAAAASTGAAASTHIVLGRLLAAVSIVAYGGGAWAWWRAGRAMEEAEGGRR